MKLTETEEKFARFALDGAATENERKVAAEHLLKSLRDRGIKYSRPHLWRMWNAGQFPRPVKVSPQRNAWLEADIDAWIESLVAERAPEQAA